MPLPARSAMCIGSKGGHRKPALAPCAPKLLERVHVHAAALPSAGVCVCVPPVRIRILDGSG